MVPKQIQSPELLASLAASSIPTTTPRELPEHWLAPIQDDESVTTEYVRRYAEAYARQAIAESEARAEGLRKSLAEMIELRQAAQDGRATEKHELDIVRDAKAAIAQGAKHEK
jgi:hypothetical protein